MNRSERTQSKHHINKVLVVIAVIGILAAAGGTVFVQHRGTNKPIAATDSSQSSATQTNNIATQPSPLVTYTSTIGGFSFSYPSGWKVTEGQAGVDDQILIAPSSASTSSANQFLMTLLVAGNPDVSDPPTAVANGTVQKLTNGINLWISTSASATKPAASAGRTTCPELEITNADQSHFSYALPNGQNLALIAGYCQGQNSTTSLTYQQQLATQDWQTAVSIIKSIQFN